jgi:hypothetical protein
MNLNIPIKLIDNVCKKRGIQPLSEMLYEHQSELMQFWIKNKCSQYVCYGCKDPENPCAYASESGCTHPDHPMKKFKSKLENSDGVGKSTTND